MMKFPIYGNSLWKNKKCSKPPTSQGFAGTPGLISFDYPCGCEEITSKRQDLGWCDCLPLF
jgi:hypothetical protein